MEDVFVFHGYAVESAADGPEGLRKAMSGTFDLILLDIKLPGMGGFEICHRLRMENPEQPIIMLTAKTSDEDIIQCLSLGAEFLSDDNTTLYSLTEVNLIVPLSDLLVSFSCFDFSAVNLYA